MGHQRPHANQEKSRATDSRSATKPTPARWSENAREEHSERAATTARDADDRAGRQSDESQGYSQDSGYPQSGGYEDRPADQANPGSARDDSETHEHSQIRIHASDALDAPAYDASAGSGRGEGRSSSDLSAAGQRSDERIRATLHDLLAGRASPRGVLVTVAAGDVMLEGEVADSEERAELEEIVRQTPGVRSVANRMVSRR